MLDHLNFFSAIDPAFHHLIFYNNSIQGISADIFLNVFILEWVPNIVTIGLQHLHGTDYLTL
jgi:hypothetical protein